MADSTYIRFGCPQHLSMLAYLSELFFQACLEQQQDDHVCFEGVSAEQTDALLPAGGVLIERVHYHVDEHVYGIVHRSLSDRFAFFLDSPLVAAWIRDAPYRYGMRLD